MADSVAFPPQTNSPVDAGLGGEALDTVKEIASNVNANISNGSEDLKQRSIDSENVMNMPDICKRTSLHSQR